MYKTKNIDFNWMKKIPPEWDIYNFKYIIEEKIDNRGRTPELNNLNEGIPIIEMNAIGCKNPNVDVVSKFITKESYKKYIRKELKTGDVLFGTVGSIGKCSIVPEIFDYCIAQNIVGYRFNKNQVPLYWFYYFNSIVFEETYKQYNKGNIQDSVKISDLERGKVIVPPKKEQILIANFLDDKIGTMEEIIEDLNDQIEILNKYKNQLISEVVTRGLNKKVAMKDSEVEWIGSIPEHWNIKLIKNICSLKGRIGWEGLTKDEYISEGPTLITGINFNNGSIDWDSCEHVSEWRYNQDKSIQIKNKDLLITKDGTVGKVAIVKDCPEKVTLNSGVLLLRPLNNEYIEKYLYYVLLSNEFWHWFEIENIGNTTIIHLYQNRFAKFKLALPPIDEQKEIANYLDKKCSEIDEILNSKMKQKEQMEQYKKSVIYEYVTGKKRVEGAEELYG